MTRRGFLSQVLKAGVAAAILPAATTYARSKWIKPSVTSNLWIPNPAYETAEYEVVFLIGKDAYTQTVMGPPPLSKTHPSFFKRVTI